jgi:hypothetical protein
MLCVAEPRPRGHETSPMFRRLPDRSFTLHLVLPPPPGIHSTPGNDDRPHNREPSNDVGTVLVFAPAPEPDPEVHIPTGALFT